MIVGCPNYLNLSSTQKWLIEIVENTISRLPLWSWKAIQNHLKKRQNHLISLWRPYPPQKKHRISWNNLHKPLGLLHQQSGFAPMGTSWVSFKSMVQSTGWVAFHLGMFLWLRSAFLSIQLNLNRVWGCIHIQGAHHENHQKHIKICISTLPFL